jgi:hypothetical protein
MIDFYKDTDLAGVQIIQRGSVEDIDTPSLAIIAARSEPTDDGEGPSGNWNITIQFTLKTHYKDNGIAQHDEWLGIVTDLICDQTVVDTLNKVMSEEAFTAMAWTLGSREHFVEDHMFVSIISGVLYMLPSK